MLRILTILCGFTLLLTPLKGQTFFEENFDATTDTTLPSGWTQQTLASDSGYRTGTNLSLSSSEFPFAEGTGRFVATNDDACNCDKSNDFLISPLIPLDTLSTHIFLSVDVYYGNGRIGSKQETATLEVSIDSGTTWQVLGQFSGKAAWQNYQINLSNFAGNSNIMLGFRYKDAGGWLFGLGLDNIKVYVPPVNEVKLLGFQMDEYVMLGNNNIKGVIYNMGSDTIRSITVEYTVDNGTPVTSRVSGLSVAPLAGFQLVHPTPWNATDPGTFNFSFRVSLPNDQDDADTTNNFATSSTIVATNAVIRTTLVEEFTSSTCNPCAFYNQSFIPIMIDDFGANRPDSRVAAVNFHMNFPAPGNDPSNNADAEARRANYGVTSTPSMFADGKSFYSNPRTTIENSFARPSAMKVEMETIVRNDSLVTEVTVTPYIAKPAGLRLFIALTEDYCNYTGTNGEIEFIYVMRKMLPNAGGKVLPALVPNQPFHYSSSYKIESGTVGQSNFNFWSSDIAGYTSVAWVQDMNSRHVYQAAMDESVTVGVNKIEESFPAKFFPNPGNGLLYIQAELPQQAPVTIQVFNMTGQLVSHEMFGQKSSGQQYFQADLQHLPDGVYLVQLTAGNNQVVRKVSISR